MPLRNVATNYTFEQQRQEINLLAADVDSLSTTLTNQQATETTDSPSFNNLYLGSVIYGPSIFTIDPATHGDDTGTLVVKGNLQIDGTTTTVNSTTMSVNDLNITLADGAANAAAANGAGITVDGAGATLLYNGSTDEWAFNKSLTSLSVSGTSTFNASPLGAANVGVLIDGASGAVVTAATGTNSLFKGFTQGTNTATVNIKANGSAEFASGNLFLNFVSDGANVVARNDSTNNPVYEVYKGGLTANDRTVRINSDGSSAFSGQLNLGANMQFTAADPELEFNNGGPRFKVPAANTLSIHSGGGLGTTTAERLRVDGDGRVTVFNGGTNQASEFNAGANQFVITNNDNCGITIDSTSNTSGSIHFADGPTGSESYRGIIEYDHSIDSMKFYTSATQRFSMNSVGTFNFLNGLLVENGIIDTTARNGVQAVNLDNGMVHYFQSSATGTWKPNFRVNSTNTLNNAMNIGDFCSPTMLVNKQNSAHYADSVQIDGSDVTVDWLGGPPTEGGGNNTWDVYSYTILKTGASTFKCWASVSTYNQ